MAQGYARASGNVGVAIATSGPGATNLVTPIADAWMDSTPLVCITGQVRSTLIGTDGFQECDITGITMPIVKHSWLVQDAPRPALDHARRLPRRADRTLWPRRWSTSRATSRRRSSTSSSRAELDLPGWRPPTKVHPLQIREAGRAVANARKPVLYVGGGTLNGDACDELLELAEAGSLPVVTTLMGKGAFPEDHELHFGWPGMHGPKWSNLAINSCDVLVAVGARFDDRVTGKLSAFAPGATVVHLDVDAAEISKLRDADIPVVGALATAVGRAGARGRATPRRGRAGAGGVALADPRVARGVPAPLRPRRRVAQAPDRRGDAAAAHRRRRRDRHDRGRPAPDVGDAVRDDRPPAELHHFGRPRDDGIRHPRGDRREGCPPGGDGRVRRRRRVLPDDRAGARDGRRRRTCRSWSSS